MEDIILIFPHIAKQIFEKLDNKDLTNCRLVVKSWKNFIDEQNLPWTRIVIQKYRGEQYTWKYFGELQETPLHLAAKYGQFETFKMLCKDYEDINPMTKWEVTPLELAVQNNHLEFCQFIIDNLKDNSILTAEKKGGYLLWKAKDKKIYELIMGFCTDINPANNGGSTPFHSAALQGNYSLCEFLIDKLEDKNPKSIYDHTPLHSAADMGHLDICALIVRNIPKSKLLEELNIKYTLTKDTPIDMARGRDHTNVVEFLQAVQNTGAPLEWVPRVPGNPTFLKKA